MNHREPPGGLLEWSVRTGLDAGSRPIIMIMQCRPSIFRRTIRPALAALAACTVGGCYAGFDTIDDRVDDLLSEASGELGPEGAPAPVVDAWGHITVDEEMLDEKNPPTFNPPASEMEYVTTSATDAEQVLQRLQNYQEMEEDALELGLQESLLFAFRNAREFQFAQEEYILACLSLLIEQHRWVPRFFDNLTTSVIADPDNGFYTTSMSVVNEWGVTQKLPYGGEVSARYLASFSDFLHQEVTQGDDPSRLTSQFVLGASIPFLRGSGPIAQESLIQAERNLVYAARRFEDFRRNFLVRLTTDFLNLQVERRRVLHTQQGIEYYDKLTARQQALYDAGRANFYQTAEAENSALSEKAKLARQWEAYRLSVDRFKRLIGMDIGQPVVISEDALALEVPQVSMEQAVTTALTNRLDLQTERDRLVDSQRAIRNAENGLLPDLNLDLQAAIDGRGDSGWDGIDPDFEDVGYNASLRLGIPLDREIEKLRVRQAQINLERAQRAFILFRDTLVIDVRSAVRDIDANLFALDMQRRNVEIAELGMASIEADPDRVSVLSSLQSIQQLIQAQDGRDSAFRDLQLSILKYLNDSGQLRVHADGTLELLPGMKLVPYQDLVSDDPKI